MEKTQALYDRWNIKNKVLSFDKAIQIKKFLQNQEMFGWFISE